MDRSSDPAAALKLDLDRYVPGLLVWLSNKMSASASQLYREHFDLGVTDWRVLAYIYIYPWSTAAQVCQLIGLDKAAVSRSLAYMEKRGLLKSRPSGKRKVEYLVTAQGGRLYEKVSKVALAREEALLTGYSDKERDQLIKFLHRLLDNLPAVERVGADGLASEDN
ncbi:MAG TPA: MarR family winged helix-turn-helix transcriptional regulator [Burkholderiaceae bacterium]|nr:MarR family winged helix-turn-helix transcriptional regulator [Burkholderiaceae bacterium]